MQHLQRHCQLHFPIVPARLTNADFNVPYHAQQCHQPLYLPPHCLLPWRKHRKARGQDVFQSLDGSQSQPPNTPAHMWRNISYENEKSYEEDQLTHGKYVILYLHFLNFVIILLKYVLDQELSKQSTILKLKTSLNTNFIVGLG